MQIFKLISGSDEFAVVLMEDYISHVKMKRTLENSATIQLFVNMLLTECVDVCIDTNTLLNKHNIKEKDIT